MDSESRGQVGGLECGEGTRRALAGESRGWRCGGCGGRRNEEILGEVVEAVREKEGKGRGEEVQVQVPRELRLAYRDEMGAGRRLGSTEEGEAGTAAPTADANPPLDGSQPSVQDPPTQPTRTIPAQSPPQQQLRQSQDTQQRPQQNSPRAPTSQTQTQTQTTPQPLTPNHNRDRNHDSAVPAWLDRAIVGVALGLAVMVCKKLVYL